jgi:hypothetical protein
MVESETMGSCRLLGVSFQHIAGAAICDFEAEGRKLSNFQTLAVILRSAKDADFRMTRQNDYEAK